MHQHYFLWRVLWTRSIASMTLIALLAGCATMLSARAAKIADTDEVSLIGCEFVGQVKGFSGRGNLEASTGMEKARNEARENAAKLGATDIVWRSVSVGYSPYVSGTAYVCNPPRP
jgi:hypothetical protein